MGHEKYNTTLNTDLVTFGKWLVKKTKGIEARTFPIWKGTLRLHRACLAPDGPPEPERRHTYTMEGDYLRSREDSTLSDTLTLVASGISPFRYTRVGRHSLSANEIGCTSPDQTNGVDLAKHTCSEFSVGVLISFRLSLYRTKCLSVEAQVHCGGDYLFAYFDGLAKDIEKRFERAPKYLAVPDLPTVTERDIRLERGTGRPGLSRDELVRRLAMAQEAEEIRSQDHGTMMWKTIATAIHWNYGGTQAGKMKLLEDARKRLKRLKEDGDPDAYLLDVAEWRKRKETP